MIGVVLCGGQSSRMGSDKGLLNTNGIAWAQMAIGKLSSLQIPVVLCVNKLQYGIYKATFSSATIITDDDSLTLNGPLLGVMTAHHQHPMEHLFVLACDMSLMESSLLADLYNCSLQNDGYDGFVFINEDAVEPLCAIYCANGLTAIAEMHRKGLLKRHSMKYMIENLHIFFLPVTAIQKKYFTNFNTHADLNGL